MPRRASNSVTRQRLYARIISEKSRDVLPVIAQVKAVLVEAAIERAKEKGECL